MKQDVMTREPIRRSAFRLWMGKQYYCLRRRILWYSGRWKFAKPRPDIKCPYLCASHATPLLRKLKKLDMYLQENKVHNLSLAIPRLDGVVLRPGETLSYWQRIGNPNSRKGYREGMQLKNGRVSTAIGGGLCQCSNLIYWITLHTPLTVTERHRHGYDVFPDVNRTQPFGCGATGSYNYVDLMIRNDTPHTWRLKLWKDDTCLHGEWYCDAPLKEHYEVYEREHWMQSEYWGGFTRHNVIARKVYDEEGSMIADEYVTENHVIMMYSPMLSESGEAGKGG